MSVRLLTASILKQQDDVCSAAIIQHFGNTTAFKNLSQNEWLAIFQRDKEDENKLSQGINIAIAKGILKSNLKKLPTTRISVAGRTVTEVTAEIIRHLPSHEGNVIVLQGLSGTGKGTTVSRLRELLPRCVVWSNGNVFRSYTHLCNEELSKKGQRISEDTLTPELLSSLAKRITFEKTEDDGQYHTVLDGSVRVEDIENTVLKTSLINQNVPTVAKQTQGEVILFTMGALRQLSAAGYNVVVEGRAQTLDYIQTEERFELVMPDTALLGQRRAAQRVMAGALGLIGGRINALSDGEVARYAEEALLHLTH